MALRCCLFERSNGERYTHCTTDADCSKETSVDKFISSWGIDSCDNCKITPVEGSEGGEGSFVFPPAEWKGFLNEYLAGLRPITGPNFTFVDPWQAAYLAHLIKEILEGRQPKGSNQ